MNFSVNESKQQKKIVFGQSACLKDFVKNYSKNVFEWKKVLNPLLLSRVSAALTQLPSV